MNCSIELVLKPIHIPYLNITKLVPKQHVEPIWVLAINLVIPPDIVMQHLPEIFFHLEVGEIIINETPTRERVQYLTIAGWIVIEEEQLTKNNLGTKENIQ
jgi:hypothetical protein